MSIVRGVYEGLTAITYSLILDVIMKVLLLMGFTDIVYDLLQLITVILWIGIGMFGWNNVCIIIHRGGCRLSTMYRYIMFIAPTTLAISYIFYLYHDFDAAALLFLISISILLGLSVAGYVGALMLSNQFRNNLGRVGSVISIIAVIMWLALVPSVMEAGTAINAIGNASMVISILQLRKRYVPTRRVSHR